MDIGSLRLVSCLTGSGLCEAVTMTPIVFPSNFLLRRPAITPTLNRTESRVFPLFRDTSVMRFPSECFHVQCSESCSTILETNILGFGVEIG